MEQIERARERLENVQGVKPILGGLRTISLGSWQAALKRRSSVRHYALRLGSMLPWLLPHLETRRGLLSRARTLLSPALARLRDGEPDSEAAPKPSQIKVLVIGSERGLCGRFNSAAADQLDAYLRDESSGGAIIELMVLGGRAQRILERRGYEPTPAGTLSMTTLPSPALPFDLARRWLGAYEDRQLDRVDLIYNRYRGTGTYEPTTIRLIPPQLPTDERPAHQQPPGPGSGELRGRPSAESGPTAYPPIVDTDPLSLYAAVLEQSVAVRLYGILLDSAAAEHSTRFQLMESATQNADRLIEELTLATQTARRQAITQEMQELAAGAGLLGRQ